MGIKILFMGTPEFAVPCLEMLVKEGYNIVAVVTQSDKPKGRGNKLTAPPVKEFALNHGIEVLQPDRIRTPEFEMKIREINPDLFVTVAYGKIIPKNILDIPSLGCINVHGSLLPKLRGAAPIHRSIILGETESGITTMYTDVGTDTGDMLLNKAIAITGNMTTGQLHDELSIMGAEVLKETLIKLQKGELIRISQINEEATYAPMIEKNTGEIAWQKSALEIHNLVRGTNPKPGAFTFYKSLKMRIWKTEIPEYTNSDLVPGTILKANKEGLILSTGKGMIKVTELQFDSNKRMSVEEYLRGHRLEEGEIFG